MKKDVAPVVTIDGPAGSGKGTIARQLAASLQYHYLDSGVLYRILALLSLQHDIAADDVERLIDWCQKMEVYFKLDACGLHCLNIKNVPLSLNDKEITHALRTEKCAAVASRIAVQPKLREALLAKQRSFKKSPGLVAEGRDMGTVVFPNARCKLFLTASPHERALRRRKQLKKQGISVRLDTLLKDIEMRDSRDQDREVSPLRPATDALLVDSTDLSIEQVVNRITEHVRGRQITDPPQTN